MKPLVFKGSRNAADVSYPRPAHKRTPWDPALRGNEVTDLLDLLGYLEVESWMEDSSCKYADDPDAWFPSAGTRPPSTVLAIRICERCPVRMPCLEYALARPGLAGIWAGLGEHQRRALREQRNKK